MNSFGEFNIFNKGDRVVCINNRNIDCLSEGSSYIVKDVDVNNIVIDINNIERTVWSARFMYESEYVHEKLEILKEERKEKLEKLEAPLENEKGIN